MTEIEYRDVTERLLDVDGRVLTVRTIGGQVSRDADQFRYESRVVPLDATDEFVRFVREEIARTLVVCEV